MKRSVLLLLFFVLLASLFVSCAEGECHHQNIASEQILPTCSAEGYTLRTCQDCGYSYKSDFVVPTGHSMVSAVVLPHCEEEGYTEFSCSACDFSYRSNYTAPTGHSLEKAILAPTCTEPGYTEFACTVCGFSYQTDYTASTGHTYEEKVIPADCSTAGYTEHKCKTCGFTYNSDFKDSLGHKLQKQVVAPSCTAGGYTEYTCRLCSFSFRTAYVDATGHSFVTSRKSPTMKKAGYLLHQCEVCGHSYKSDSVCYEELLLSTDPAAYSTTKRGVDLSRHNGSVDFEKLRDAGIDFVILRAGFQVNGKDEKFEEFYAAATAAGLEIGCYLYTESKSVTAIHSDVTKLLGYIAGKTFTYPIYLDMEIEAQKNLGSGTLKKMILAFAEDLLAAGYLPGLYTNKDWLDTVLAGIDPPSFIEVCIARHYPALKNSNPDYYRGQYGLWQYCGSEAGEEFETVDGVDGRVDINVGYRDYPAIVKKYGFNGY